jgi:hypothetical protein
LYEAIKEFMGQMMVDMEMLKIVSSSFSVSLYAFPLFIIVIFVIKRHMYGRGASGVSESMMSVLITAILAMGEAFGAPFDYQFVSVFWQSGS